jgi:succinate dehydrogenase flavin-adding protein (antitoxin of CptAB toxin-antitoxin module)
VKKLSAALQTARASQAEAQASFLAAQAASTLACSALDATEVDLETKRAQGLDSAVKLLEVFATASRHQSETAQEQVDTTRALLEASTEDLMTALCHMKSAQARQQYLQQLLQALQNATAAASFAQSQKKKAADLQDLEGKGEEEAWDVQVCCWPMRY